jgi:hypothetical protein
MTGHDDDLDNQDLKRLQLYVYLVPILGFFPALWTLYRRQGTAKQQHLSRLAILMALLWLSGATVLTGVSQQSDFLQLPTLLVSSLWTSGYLLLNLGLMIRLWKGKSLPLNRKRSKKISAKPRRYSR